MKTVLKSIVILTAVIILSAVLTGMGGVFITQEERIFYSELVSVKTEPAFVIRKEPGVNKPVLRIRLISGNKGEGNETGQ